MITPDVGSVVVVLPSDRARRTRGAGRGYGMAQMLKSPDPHLFYPGIKISPGDVTFDNFKASGYHGGGGGEIPIIEKYHNGSP